ncbi:hypothetical protein ACFQO1_05225 [Jejudonia soesokkakensis]|uniref:Uncharacterized protein n=1 Tax=Jejudonia soesokkakensis TaxID=1323432 RepID=A0ABW2MQS4_9FLAO
MQKHKTRFVTPKFTIFILIVGFVFFILGIAFLFRFDSKIGGIILVILGIYLGFSHNGIDIDITNNRFRKFTSHFGIKTGDWKNFKYYPYLSLLTINQKQTTYSYTNAQNTTKFIVYRIYLLNKKHTEKILIREFRSKSKADKEIAELENELNLKIDVYSPDFS